MRGADVMPVSKLGTVGVTICPIKEGQRFRNGEENCKEKAAMKVGEGVY